jgi:hypothetical protein
MHRMLVLYATPDPRYERLTTLQHLAAVSRLDEPAEVLAYNAVQGAPSWLRHIRFDAIVLHTTLLCYRWTPSFVTWKRRLEWLADLPAVKIAFPQDEYDHAHVLDEWLDELGVEVVCTVVDGRHRSELYPALSHKATFYEVLTGYIDEDSAQRLRARMRPFSERTYDLVYRARNLPYWFGSHGQGKHLIGQEVVVRADRHGLSHDISTRIQDAILGDAWLDFLGTGRATVGTETGSSVLDPRGKIQARIRELLQEEPGLSFDDVSRLMPTGWDDYRFFAVSPRHLEAVATKTAQILVRGSYSGVLEPGRHYLAIEPDLSDLDEALEQVREPRLMEELAERAYEDVYLSGRWSFHELTRTLSSIVREHSETASGGRGVAFFIGAPAARRHRDVEQKLVARAAYLFRTGRGSAAVLRLLADDRTARRLLALYLRFRGVREHVGTRDAVVDILCVTQLRRAVARRFDEGAPFRVEVHVDRARHHVTFRSVADRNGAAENSMSEAATARLLSEHDWEFTWDHSAVAKQAHYPILGSLRTPLYLHQGVRDLATLRSLARYRPRDVAKALAPVLSRDGRDETNDMGRR